MNETKECERHDKYKSADARTRRKELAFVATGPLVLTHQTELVNMLKEICPESHELMHRFSTYDYDVLYPEAVIWALQKMHRTAYARAEARYKSGFELDDEERLKHACNRILNEENEKEAIAAEEAAPKTSPKTHDSSNVSSMSEMSNANDDNGDLSSEESFPMLDI